MNLDWKLAMVVGLCLKHGIRRNKTLILSILPKSWICNNKCEFIFIHFKLLKTFFMFCPSVCLLNQCVQLFLFTFHFVIKTNWTFANAPNFFETFGQTNWREQGLLKGLLEWLKKTILFEHYSMKFKF